MNEPWIEKRIWFDVTLQNEGVDCTIRILASGSNIAEDYIEWIKKYNPNIASIVDTGLRDDYNMETGEILTK